MRGQGDEEYRRQLRSENDRLDRLDRLNRRAGPVTARGIGSIVAVGLVVVVACMVVLAFALYAAWYTVNLNARSPFDDTALIALYCAGAVPWLIECWLRVRAYRRAVRDRPQRRRHPRLAGAVRRIRARTVLTLAPIWTFFLGIEALDGHVPAGARMAVAIGIPAAQGAITYLIWR